METKKGDMNEKPVIINKNKLEDLELRRERLVWNSIKLRVNM